MFTNSLFLLRCINRKGDKLRIGIDTYMDRIPEWEIPFFNQELGKIFWDLYQFFGRVNGPNFLLDLTCGICEWIWREWPIIHAVHHCWHCPDYTICEYRNAGKTHITPFS
jgi:hypothetical protein